MQKKLKELNYLPSSDNFLSSIASSSWFPGNWKWNWRHPFSIPAPDPTDKSIWTLSDEQREQLYETIDYYRFIQDSVKKEEDTEDTVYFEFQFHLHQSSIILGGSESPLGELRFEEFLTKITVFKTTLQLAMTLQLMELIDIMTLDTHFRYLISPLKLESSRFLSLLLKYKPYDLPDVDILIELQAEPLEICYNQKWINSFVSFFLGGVTQSVVESGAKTFSKIRAQYAEQLAFTIEKNPSISICAFIEAPKIVIPANVTEDNTPLLVANLGNVSIHCSPQNKSHLSSSTIHEELLYTRLNVFMQSLSLRTTLFRRRERFIIENFKAEFILDVCMASQPNLARSRIYFKLPKLKVTLSPSMLNNLTFVLNALISDISSPTKLSPVNLENSPTLSENSSYSQLRHSFRQSFELPRLTSNQDFHSLESRERINFEGHFFITLFSIRLAHDGEELHPFIQLDLENFETKVKNTSFESNIILKLRSLSLSNLLSKSANTFIAKTLHESSSIPYVLVIITIYSKVKKKKEFF